MFAQKKDLHEEAWLLIELVWIQNQYNTSHWIYRFNYATHNIKNMRVQLWISEETGSKLFYDAEGHIMRKCIFEEDWLSEEERADSNNTL